MPNYRRVARRKAKKYGLDPKTFQRQIKHESGYRQDVITGATASSAGAQGIAQIMPSTAQAWGVDPLKPKQALDAAAKHMAEYVKQYGSYKNALVAYNAGPGRVGMPLYAETAQYIARILGNSEGQTRLYEPEEVGAKRPTRDKPDRPKPDKGPSDLQRALGGPQEVAGGLSAALALVRDEMSPLDFAREMASQRPAPPKPKLTSDGEQDDGGPSPGRQMRDNGKLVAQYGTEKQKVLTRMMKTDAEGLPYQWGGGHSTITLNKHGFTKKGVPLDCSGAVSRALGISPRVSGQFESWGKPGRGGNVLVAANAGHVLMAIKVKGKWKWWGTSGQNPGGGAGWIDEPDAGYLSGFTMRHAKL